MHMKIGYKKKTRQPHLARLGFFHQNKIPSHSLNQKCGNFGFGLKFDSIKIND